MILNISALLKYLLLGLIQGIAEPLPISSSAHVLIFSNILNINISNGFTLWVNIGSFIAIIIFFRKFLWRILGGFFNYIFKKDDKYREDFFYCLFIILATIPAAIIGLIFKDQIDKLTSFLLIGICEIITGLILLYASYVPKTDSTKKVDFKTSLGIGLSQIVALIPGISRSGVTTSFGLSRKLSLERALTFSFMLYLPISFATSLLGIIKLDFSTISLSNYLGAFITSFLGTIIVIHLFFKYIKKSNLKYFGYYCVVLGIIVLILFGGK